MGKAAALTAVTTKVSMLFGMCVPNLPGRRWPIWFSRLKQKTWMSSCIAGWLKLLVWPWRAWKKQQIIMTRHVPHHLFHHVRMPIFWPNFLLHASCISKFQPLRGSYPWGGKDYNVHGLCLLLPSSAHCATMQGPRTAGKVSEIPVIVSTSTRTNLHIDLLYLG